jgi:hypothetical protein
VRIKSLGRNQMNDPVTIERSDLHDILYVGRILAEVLDGKYVTPEEERRLTFAYKLLGDLIIKFANENH